MKTALLLASTQIRGEVQRREIGAKLEEWRREADTEEDLAYLRLAEVLLTGRDSRPLPSDEKVDLLLS